MQRSIVSAVALLMIVSGAISLASASDVRSRCQSTAVGSPCSFSCHAGEVLGASGIGNTGANATCGGASTSCQGSVDCLGQARIVSYNGTGTCSMLNASGEYADCFTLAAPPAGAASCSASDDYDACSYVCNAGATLNVSATDTSAGGGWPRVLSVCGGGAAECQNVNACAGSGQAQRAGAGICLGRTVHTNITCTATGGNATPPPQNDAGSGGDVSGSQAYLIATGNYTGMLQPSQGDVDDVYEAVSTYDGHFGCSAGDYRVHIDGAGVQVRLDSPWGVILDTPADFRGDGCIAWSVQPTQENRNSTASLDYSMVLVTPTFVFPPQPDFAVSQLNVSPPGAQGASGVLGQNVTVSFVVTNVGNVSGNGTATLWVSAYNVETTTTDTIATNLSFALAPGASTVFHRNWSTADDVGTISVNARVDTPDQNASNNFASTSVIVGAALPNGYGVVAGPEGRSAANILRVPGNLRLASTTLNTIDAACANPVVRVVDNGSGNIWPRACAHDYYGADGGLWLPIIGVPLCDPARVFGIYQTVAQVMKDKPGCSPTLNETAHQYAPLIDDAASHPASS